MQDAIDWGKNRTTITIARLQELERKEKELDAIKSPLVDDVEYLPSDPENHEVVE